jgi:PAS domain S-box-containing protein
MLAGRNLCLAGAAIGVIGLFGWLTGMIALTSVVPGQPRMMPNTAFGLMLLGFAGALHHPNNPGLVSRLSGLAAFVVLALGLTTIAEYLVELPFTIDQLLVRTDVGLYPGRPSPPVAIALTLLSAAILVSGWRGSGRIHPSEWLILSAGVIAFSVALGQLFGVGLSYQLSDMAVGIAVPTAVSLVLISTGLLFVHPESGIMRIASSPTPGGMMLRRLVPAFIFIALALGLSGPILIEIVGQEYAAFVRAGLTILGIAVVLPLFALTARWLNRAHEALRRAQTQHSELIQLASDGIFVADLEGRFTEVNDAGCRLLGFTREEILGKTIMDFILPEEKERLFGHRERFLKGGTDIGEWVLRKKDGTYIPVEVSAKILPDGRWLAIDRDISERKRAEDALRQAQERLELALRGGNLGSWDWNIVTGEVVANRRCAEMRGFQPEEIVPRVDSYLTGIHPDDLPAFRKALSDCFDGVRPDFECEYRVRTKSGEWVWILSQGNIFGRNEQGRPTRMVGIALDVTPRKSAEQALRQSEAAARQAAQARDDMLGIIAHDLRNPLAAIATSAAVLQQTGREREIGDEIAHAADRMKRLIRDLIDVTLLDAGTFRIKQEPIRTAALLSEVFDSQALLASSASVDLRLDVLQDDSHVWADRDRLLQVFENLVGNAIKFTEPGGEIVLGARAGAGEVLFSVADTGCGIASNQLPRVFDRFWQAPEGKRQGAGLGLPIVKGIVEAHGGRIWAQSTPGRGSTFFFTIPAAQASHDCSDTTLEAGSQAQSAA